MIIGSMLNIISLFCMIVTLDCSLVTLQPSARIDDQFQMTYKQYLKKYKPSELANSQNDISVFKEKNFLDNLKLINEHNSNPDSSFTMGINKFTDMDPKQFKQTYLTTTKASKILMALPSYISHPKSNETAIEQSWSKMELPPIKIDWRKYGGFVYQTNYCVMDFAVAPIQTIQITHSIKIKMQAPTRSIQQVISCSKSCFGNKNCTTNNIIDTYKYVIEKGVGLQEQYRFRFDTLLNCEQVACQKQKNQFKKNKLFLSDIKIINKKNSCCQIVEVLKLQSLTILIATHGLSFYNQGIFRFDSTQPKDYAVPLVGYNGVQSAPYFIIKNSWGTEWGYKGYGYVAMENGVCDHAVAPILKQQSILNPKN